MKRNVSEGREPHEGAEDEFQKKLAIDRMKIEYADIPDNLKESSQAQIIENWADTTLAKSLKIVFLEEIMRNPSLISSLLNTEISDSLKNIFANKNSSCWCFWSVTVRIQSVTCFC